jgi:hypothetical protein
MAGEGSMSKKIKQPDFTKGILELRCEDEKVCIYATAAGLKKLIEFCEALLARGHGHTHLEDYEVLTENSLRGALAIFPSGKEV